MTKAANLRVRIERQAEAGKRAVTREEHDAIIASLKVVGDDVSRVMNEMVERIRQTTRGTDNV
jgi:hypothetical protein